jgi:hypothetical protein
MDIHSLALAILIPESPGKVSGPGLLNEPLQLLAVIFKLQNLALELYEDVVSTLLLKHLYGVPGHVRPQAVHFCDPLGDIDIQLHSSCRFNQAVCRGLDLPEPLCCPDLWPVLLHG